MYCLAMPIDMNIPTCVHAWFWRLPPVHFVCVGLVDVADTGKHAPKSLILWRKPLVLPVFGAVLPLVTEFWRLLFPFVWPWVFDFATSALGQ